MADHVGNARGGTHPRAHARAHRHEEDGHDASHPDRPVREGPVREPEADPKPEPKPEPGAGTQPAALRDYALLADGERGALVGPAGEIVWMCAPRWDSGAVFSALIGGPGQYAVGPADRFVTGGYYEEGGLVHRSRWITGDGVVECREALAYPGDPHRAVLLRRVTALDAPVRMRVLLAPAADFGDTAFEAPRRGPGGVWTARAGGLRLRWSGGEGRAGGGDGDGSVAAAQTAAGGPALTAEFTVRPGEDRDLVLEISDRELPRDVPDPARLWRSTEQAWRQAVPPLDAVIAPRDARHAHAVMRGLTGTSGGMVAAATTSLPERAEEGRNYDYRYVWIRDQCYAGQAAAAAGALPLLDDAVRFVTARVLDDGPALAPAYTVDGRGVPDQRRLDLPGYPGGFDRVGNRVNRQFQLDAFGEVLLLLSAAARLGRLDGDGRRAARIAAEAVRDRWTEPDAGVWELDPRNWAHSRLTCAAGLRAAARACAPVRLATEWDALADTLTDACAADCAHPAGRWRRSPEDPGLDAALLLPPLRGALPADDPMTVGTLRAYVDQLTEDHFAYRFRHDDRPLAQAEGAFVLCGFVVALAEHQQGRTASALRWFERNRAAGGSAGLFAEEYDVAQRQLRGNLPQAFVHALMLECAARLAEPWPR